MRWLSGATSGGQSGHAGQQLAYCRASATSWPVDVEMHEGAGVAAFVHEIVDQPGVAAHRDALARGGEVGLVGDGVLPVGEVVGGIGQQLDQHDAEIGRPSARSSPAPAGSAGRASAGGSPDSPWRDSRYPARTATSGGHTGGCAQSKSARAFDLEGEFDRGQPRIEAGGRIVAAGIGDDAERIGGIVAGAVGADHQGARRGRRPCRPGPARPAAAAHRPVRTRRCQCCESARRR